MQHICDKFVQQTV